MLYHFCTNGLLKSLIFSSDKDYIYGMNAIGISKVRYQNISILAFCLMNNHVHFILNCSEADGMDFMKYYKQLIGNYLHLHYDKERSLDGSDIGYKAMDSPEYIIRAIAYVLRNPVSAGVKVQPAEYRWSSACLYFGSRCFSHKGTFTVGSLSKLKIRALSGSHCNFPKEWHIDEHGMIFPGDYTDYTTVENIFARPVNLMFHMTRNNDAEMEADTGMLTTCRYSDEELCASRDEIIKRVFHKSTLEHMSIEEKLLLSSLMRKRYRLGIPALGRIIGLSRNLLKQ